MNDTTWLSIRNWVKLQHYRDREPRWVKLYPEILSDKKVLSLCPEAHHLWPYLLAMAARYQNAIRNESLLIARETGIAQGTVEVGVADLLRSRLVSETATPRRMSIRASRIASKRYTGCRRAQNNGVALHFVYDTLGVDDPPRDWPYERPSKSEIDAALRAGESL